MNTPWRAAVALLLLSLVMSTPPAEAQSGQISGEVVDATGGVLPGATVTLRGGGPEGPREAQTDARGRFAFTGLAPGAYAVTVRLSGFGPMTVDVVVGAEPVELSPITLAGAVRYLPRRPDTERRTFEVRGSIDRYDDAGFIDYDYLLRTPGVSEPEPALTDPAAVVANLRREADANTEETLSARLSLLWEATPELSALFACHLQDQQVGARQINHARSFDTGRYVAAHRYLEPNDRRNQLWSLELTWAPRWAELTTAIGYSRYAARGRRDQTDLLIQAFGIGGLLPGTYPGLERARAMNPDVTAADLTSQFRRFSAYTREDAREQRFNWETRLVSTGNGPWRWVGGAFFNNYDSGGTIFELPPGLTEFSGITPILGGSPVSEPVEYYSLGSQAVEERALFGELSRDLGDRLRVTAGGRWFGYGIGGGNNFRVCTDEEIALLSDADPGNDPPQSGCIYEDQALIKPDRTTNYEVGLRRSWSDGRFNASGTLFHVDWTDIQVAGETPFSAQPITLNGARAVSRGVELAGSAGLSGARIRYTFG